MEYITKAASSLIEDTDELRKRIFLADNDLRAYELTMRIQMNLRLIAAKSDAEMMDEFERLV